MSWKDMKYLNLKDVAGTTATGVIGMMSAVTTREWLSLILVFLAVIAGFYTILNAHLNARNARLLEQRTRLEIAHLKSSGDIHGT